MKEGRKERSITLTSNKTHGVYVFMYFNIYVVYMGVYENKY